MPDYQWRPHDRPDPQGTCDLCGKSTSPFVMAWSRVLDGRLRNLCRVCDVQFGAMPSPPPQRVIVEIRDAR